MKLESAESVYTDDNLKMFAYFGQGYGDKDIALFMGKAPSAIKRRAIALRNVTHGVSNIDVVLMLIDEGRLSLQQVLREPEKWSGIPELPIAQEKLLQFIIETRNIPPIVNNPGLREIMNGIGTSFFGEEMPLGACVSAYYAAKKAGNKEIASSGVGFVGRKHKLSAEMQVPTLPAIVFPVTQEAKQKALDSLGEGNHGIFLDYIPADQRTDLFYFRFPELLIAGNESVEELLYKITDGVPKERRAFIENIIQRCLDKLPITSHDGFPGDPEEIFFDVDNFSIVDRRGRSQRFIIRVHFMNHWQNFAVHRRLVEQYAKLQGLEMPYILEEREKNQVDNS